MKTQKNFIIVENLQKKSDVGMNIDDRAIPITFMDFRNRYKIDKNNLLPIPVTQRNFIKLIWKIFDEEIQIENIEIENNEDLSEKITKNIEQKNKVEIKQNINEIKDNNFEIKKIEVKMKNKTYKINKKGVLTVSYEENDDNIDDNIIDVLNDDFIFDAIGV